jgi:hypothetical protein
VGETLEKLSKISAAIRLAGSQYRNTRAAQFRGPDADDFERYLNYIVDREYPRAVGYLRRRIVESNVNRLNVFSYAQQHFSKMASGITHQPLISPEISKKHVEISRQDLRFPPKSHAPTRTSASHIGLKGIQIPSTENEAHSAPTVVSRRTFMEAKHEVCQPPSVSKGQKYFVCPFCWQSLPVTYLEEAKWK